MKFLLDADEVKEAIAEFIFERYTFDSEDAELSVVLDSKGNATISTDAPAEKSKPEDQAKAPSKEKQAEIKAVVAEVVEKGIFTAVDEIGSSMKEETIQLFDEPKPNISTGEERIDPEQVENEKRVMKPEVPKTELIPKKKLFGDLTIPVNPKKPA